MQTSQHKSPESRKGKVYFVRYRLWNERLEAISTEKQPEFFSFLENNGKLYDEPMHAYLKEDITSYTQDLDNKHRKLNVLPNILAEKFNQITEDEILVYNDAGWKIEASCIAGIDYSHGRMLLSWYLNCPAAAPAQAEARAIRLAMIIAMSRRWKKNTAFVPGIVKQLCMTSSKTWLLLTLTCFWISRSCKVSAHNLCKQGKTPGRTNLCTYEQW